MDTDTAFPSGSNWVESGSPFSAGQRSTVDAARHTARTVALLARRNHTEVGTAAEICSQHIFVVVAEGLFVAAGEVVEGPQAEVQRDQDEAREGQSLIQDEEREVLPRYGADEVVSNDGITDRESAHRRDDSACRVDRCR